MLVLAGERGGDALQEHYEVVRGELWVVELAQALLDGLLVVGEFSEVVDTETRQELRIVLTLLKTLKISP